MELLLVVFLLQLFLYILNTLGASTINELLWLLYNRTPFSQNSKTSAEASRLRSEVVRLKRELAATSAQDQFSKWAKLDRQHRKAAAEYDKVAASLQGAKGSFNTTASALRYVLTAAIRYVPQYWYSKQALFWVPAGWVPWVAEWLLSFPRAPMGSVSVQVWGIACAAVIGMVGEAVMAVFVLQRQQRVSRAKEKGREGSTSTSTSAASTEEKKEL